VTAIWRWLARHWRRRGPSPAHPAWLAAARGDFALWEAGHAHEDAGGQR
jgi:hypothetical protein